LYFDRFNGPDAASLLSSLPESNPKAFEDEWQDFKSGKAQLKDVARLWSEVLGAFANNEGGIVVWGIKAKKEDGVDAAHALELVPHVDTFASDLREQFRFATDPPLTGVEIRPVPLSSGATEGFVVCYIPEGPLKPYRSERSSQQFYLRVGDECRVPTVAILRRMFFPQRNARIEIHLIRTPTPAGVSQSAASFVYRIVNTSLISIEEPCVALSCEGWMLFKFDPSGKLDALPALKRHTGLLHPNMTIDQRFIAVSGSLLRPLRLWVRVYGRDMIPLTATLECGDPSDLDFRAEAACVPLEGFG
jgi:hypothetical protein